MAPISRGFGGRRREVDPSRVPPGQYTVNDFPVLSAGPTPRTPLEGWGFTIDGAVADAPRALALPDRRPRRGRGLRPVGRPPRPAAGDVPRRHPLRHEVVEARHGL